MLDEIIRLLNVERVDDLPVVLAQVYHMQIPALLDQCGGVPDVDMDTNKMLTTH